MRNLHKSPWVWSLTILVAFQFIGLAFAQGGKSQKPVRRAKRPTFESKTVDRIFFKDVFAALVGARPSDISAAAPQPRVAATGGSAPASASGGGDGGWDKLIMASTLEDEIKKLKIQIDKDVTTPSDFAGRGYQECRLHFTTLAALFGVVHEYQGDVRFKRSARAARDLFARTAANAKVGTQQVYNEAKLRKQDLQDLVSGSSVESAEKPEPPTWGDLVDRSPIMERLDISVNERLNELLSNENEFKKGNDQVLHEAEIVAVLSEILTKDGMEDGDDDDYNGFARKMRDAAREIVEGVKLNDYERARKAAGAIDQSCTECHEVYRA